MDHLLSMELFDIEKQPYLRTSGLALYSEKFLYKHSYIDSFYLVLRDFFSQILFFENLIMPVIIYNEKIITNLTSCLYFRINNIKISTHQNRND